MKKAALLLDVLYFIGIGLAFAVFLVFVPEEDRTPIAWLNFSIFLLIYTGYLGRLMVLFRPLSKFADCSPVLAAYWVWWGAYVFFSVSAMIIFYKLDMSFNKQALLQGIIFFLFLNIIAFGIWGAAWMSRSSASDQRAINGVRKIQHSASALRIAASELPVSYAENRKNIERVLDDINCMAGSGSEEAIALEEKIASLLTQLSNEIVLGISEEELARKTKELRMAVAMRKNIQL